MTTIRTNRRAEEFERALSADGAAQVDPAIMALVAVAGALAAVPQRAAPAFKETLRAQLMSEATTMAAASTGASTAAAVSVPAATAPLKALTNVLAKPAMQLATGGLATAVAVAGVGIGASRSLPGDALYGLKRTVERIQKSFAGGTIAEADAVLEHAGTRVDEVLGLLERDASLGRVEATLNELKHEIDAATADLIEQARAGSAAARAALRATIDDLTARLMALRETLPPEALEELDAAMGTLTSANAILVSLPPLPTTSPAPSKSPTKSPSPTSTTPTSPTSPPPTGIEPTITVPPPPPTTLPPLPTVDPTALVTVPPLAP